MPIAKNWLVCYLLHLYMLPLLSGAAVAWYTLVSFALVSFALVSFSLGVIRKMVPCATLLLWVQCYNALYATLSRLSAIN